MQLFLKTTLLTLLMVFEMQTLIFADEVQTLPIGAIVEEGEIVQEIAFHEGINAANKILMDYRYQLLPHLEFIKPKDNFQSSKKACDLFQKGVVALFGPSEPSVANSLLSICHHVNIPFIQTDDWWSYSTQSHDNFSINLYPQYKQINEALQDYLAKLQWNSLAFVYSQPQSLLKYEPIINVFTKNLLVQKWEEMNEENHHSVMKLLKNSGHKRFLVDIPYWQVKRFLDLAETYDMSSEYYSFVFTDMNVHLVKLNSFKVNNGANIATFTILDQTIDMSQTSNSQFIEKVYAAEQKMKPIDIKKLLPVEAAVLYDSIMLLTRGLVNLSQTRRIQPSFNLTCDGGKSSEIGLSLMNSVNSIPTDLAIKGFTGVLSLNNGVRDDFKLYIMEVHSDGMEQYGYFTKHEGVKVTKAPLIRSRRQTYNNLSKRTLRVTTIVTEPFLMRKGKDDDSNPDNWEGFCIDLLRKIAQKVGFNFTINVVADGSYGRVVSKVNGKDKWNGMIGELIERQADLAMAPLTITTERERVIDFTTPFMSVGLSILYRRPTDRKPSLFAFLEPLSIPVWGFVIAAYILVSFVLYVVARFTPYEWIKSQSEKTDSLENQFTMRNSLWFTIASLTQQGSHLSPRAVSTRILAGTWYLFTVVIICCYIANLVKLITMPSLLVPFSNAEELSKTTDIPYGTIKGGSSYSFFEKSQILTYRRMWDNMNYNKQTAFVKNVVEGVERVKNSNYAFILESVMNEFYAERNCSLMQVGGLFDSKAYGIGLPAGSELLTPISDAILELKENQDIDYLKEKWWKQYNVFEQCSESDKKSATMTRSLGLGDIGGVFVILFLGVGLSIIVSIIEFIFKERKSSPNQAPIGKNLASNTKFSVKFASSSKRPANQNSLDKEAMIGTDAAQGPSGDYNQLTENKSPQVEGESSQ